MDNDPWDDLHPYYKRKAEKEAETIDFVVTHWKGILLTLIAVGVLGDLLT